jgi:hypothetical protein
MEITRESARGFAWGTPLVFPAGSGRSSSRRPIVSRFKVNCPHFNVGYQFTVVALEAHVVNSSSDLYRTPREGSDQVGITGESQTPTVSALTVQLSVLDFKQIIPLKPRVEINMQNMSYNMQTMQYSLAARRSYLRLKWNNHASK